MELYPGLLRNPIKHKPSLRGCYDVSTATTSTTLLQCFLPAAYVTLSQRARLDATKTELQHDLYCLYCTGAQATVGRY